LKDSRKNLYKSNLYLRLTHITIPMIHSHAFWPLVENFNHDFIDFSIAMYMTSVGPNSTVALPHFRLERVDYILYTKTRTTAWRKERDTH